MSGKQKLKRNGQPFTKKLTGSESDLKSLSRLIRKYGSSAVSNQASKVVPRGPGRPSRGDLPLFESIHLAQWLEETAAEHRSNGVRNFMAAAINDLFELTIDEHEQKETGRYERFEKTTRRKLIEGRKALKRYLEARIAGPSKEARATAQKELDQLNWREK